MSKSKTLDYYNYDKLYSFNGAYNFLVGGRGLGKTFGAKVKAINAAIRRGEQFIYLRRYKEELKTARNTFFADIQAENVFPDWDFKIDGNGAYMSPVSKRKDPKRTWKLIGYFIALSTAQNQKSVAFPKVTLIIYDEFIIERGAIHYLPNESDVFNNFYSTVDRYKDKTKVLFLANSVTIMNPYFIEYEIRPDEESEFITMHDGFIVCHFPESESFKSSVFETRFGKFIKDSDYANYAVGNNFSDNHESMIGSKDSKSRYLFSLECRNGTFSVWSNIADDAYYIQAKRPKSERLFTLVAEKMDTDKTLMTFTDKPLGYLRTAFRNGRIAFDKPATRNTFTEIFKR